LTGKTSLIFEKRFTVLKTVNRFPKLNSSSFHARLIFDCRNLAIIGCRNLTGTEIRPPDSPTSESGDIRSQLLKLANQISAMVRSMPDLAGSCRIHPLIRPDLVKMAGIQPDLDGSSHFIRLDPVKMAGIQPALARSGWI
jgi:hypothetical protein